MTHPWNISSGKPAGWFSPSEAVNETLAAEMERSRRRRRAVQLRATRGRVMMQVDAKIKREALARSIYTKMPKLFHSLAKPGPAASAADAAQTAGNPSHDGWRTIAIRRPQTTVFGHVMVSVRPDDLFRDAGVVSVSRMARRERISESQAIERIRAQGGEVMSAESFLLALDKALNSVLSGLAD